jgi:hypothetical protein
MGTLIVNPYINQTINIPNPVLDLDAGNLLSYPGSGTTWYDLSGNNIHGTLINGVGYDSSNQGSLYFHRPSNNYVTLGTPALLNGVQVPLTICIWAKSIDFSAYHSLWGVYNAPSNHRIYSIIRIYSSQFQYFASSFSGGYQYDTFFSNLPINIWKFYAVRVSGTLSSPTVTAFLNNSSVTQNFNAFTPTPNLNVEFRIGDTQYNYPEYWYGNIASVKWYDSALTNEQILYIFNATKDRFNV